MHKHKLHCHCKTPPLVAVSRIAVAADASVVMRMFSGLVVDVAAAAAAVA